VMNTSLTKLKMEYLQSILQIFFLEDLRRWEEKLAALNATAHFSALEHSTGLIQEFLSLGFINSGLREWTLSKSFNGTCNWSEFYRWFVMLGVCGENGISYFYLWCLFSTCFIWKGENCVPKFWETNTTSSQRISELRPMLMILDFIIVTYYLFKVKQSNFKTNLKIF
jgi:hypothetical protein